VREEELARYCPDEIHFALNINLQLRISKQLTTYHSYYIIHKITIKITIKNKNQVQKDEIHSDHVGFFCPPLTNNPNSLALYSLPSI
jgi:hypothetical protein